MFWLGRADRSVGDIVIRIVSDHFDVPVIHYSGLQEVLKSKASPGEVINFLYGVLRKSSRYNT